MYLNKQNQTVGSWNGQTDSTCSRCNSALFPKRGLYTASHWSHYSGGNCPTIKRADKIKEWSLPIDYSKLQKSETNCHLSCKAMYHNWAGWAAEKSCNVGYIKFRFDTAHKEKKSVREFVHSLDKSYIEKNQILTTAGFDVLWFIHGEAFVSPHTIKEIKSSKGNIYLTGAITLPALNLAKRLKNVYLHLSNKFYRLYLDKSGDVVGWFLHDTQITSAWSKRFEDSYEQLTGLKFDVRGLNNTNDNGCTGEDPFDCKSKSNLCSLCSIQMTPDWSSLAEEEQFHK